MIFNENDFWFYHQNPVMIIPHVHIDDEYQNIIIFMFEFSLR